MAIQTSCPNCEAAYTLADTQAGKKVRCRKCSETFTVSGGGKSGAAKPAAAKSSKSLARDALQTSPRSSKSTPPPRTKPAAKRPRSRDDEDDDDRSDEKTSIKKKPKSSTPMILMIVGGILLLLVLCGGGGTFAVYWWVSSTVQTGIDNMAQNIPQPNPGDPFAPPGDPNFPNAGNFPLPDLTTIKDVNEALDGLKNGDLNKKNRAADWLARATVDDGRQKEVAAELEKLLGNPNTKDAGLRALVVWAGLDDAPTLLSAVDANFDVVNGQAADALVRLKYAPAAAVFAKHLSDFFQHGNAARRLGQMGAALAEKEVLKYMDSSNNEARSEALGLLRQFQTKPETMFDQAVADLKSPDSNTARQACDYIAKTPVNAARQAEVSKALETPLADHTNGETSKAAAFALKTWGTKDNVPALIAELDDKGDPFHRARQPCMDVLAKLKDERGAEAVASHLTDFGGDRGAVVRALSDMGPVAEKAVARYVNHADPGVRAEADKLLRQYGTKGDVKFDAMVADLDAADGNQRKNAAEFLTTQPLNEAHQKQVARALDRLLDDPDPFGQVQRAAAKAEVVWGDKDSVPALVLHMQKDNSNIWRECMEALGRIKDERAVVPLIMETSKGRPHVGDAQRTLIQMGPVVEAGLDNVLSNPAASALDKVGACQLLGKEIGTKASIPALTAAEADADVNVKRAAAAALTAVKKRGA